MLGKKLFYAISKLIHDNLDGLDYSINGIDERSIIIEKKLDEIIGLLKSKPTEQEPTKDFFMNEDGLYSYKEAERKTRMRSKSEF